MYVLRGSARLGKPRKQKTVWSWDRHRTMCLSGIEEGLRLVSFDLTPSGEGGMKVTGTHVSFKWALLSGRKRWPEVYRKERGK